LTLAIDALDRRIQSDGQQRAVRPKAGRWAVTGLAAEEAAVVIRRTGRRELQSGPWATVGHGPKEFFLSFVFTETVLLFFCSVF
jgi:hypothetical protein